MKGAVVIAGYALALSMLAVGLLITACTANYACIIFIRLMSFR
jgi:hypothetical protein